MNRKPLISCIIIFLNAGKSFFEEAIESIFTQTYDKWELLLVDDGSTDESTEIAQSYARQYPEKVRYLEHEGHQNRGMSAARNLGILHAKGAKCRKLKFSQNCLKLPKILAIGELWVIF